MSRVAGTKLLFQGSGVGIEAAVRAEWLTERSERGSCSNRICEHPAGIAGIAVDSGGYWLDGRWNVCKNGRKFLLKQ